MRFRADMQGLGIYHTAGNGYAVHFEKLQKLRKEKCKEIRGASEDFFFVVGCTHGSKSHYWMARRVWT